MKKALITGITGQDGAYLTELLLSKGYEVHGVKRRVSVFNTDRIDHLINDPLLHDCRLILHHGDMTDSSSLFHIIQKVQPDEIYNLAAQSHVAVSFEEPEYTANADGLGALRILEALRILGMQETCRYYQASTSELYGLVREVPQSEKTPFYPRSPYAVAKLYAYWISVNYREAYSLFTANGILFNHESPLRGETFVTRKITRGLADYVLTGQGTIHLGNLEARRDWGHARDFVEAMWLILQARQPDDYVIATGIQHSVRDFIEHCARALDLSISWQGTGASECAVDTQNGHVIIRVDPAYYRPAEVDSLLGDSRKAREQLGWKPKISFEQLVEEMINADLQLASRRASLGSYSGKFFVPQ
jgi:GDPmannose 4,6-dehydratase